jgi:hypothetical protein
LGESPEEASKYIENASGSKYNTEYTYASEAPSKEIPLFETIVQNDTIVDDYRNVTFTIYPKRGVNQISLYADKDILFHSLQYNGKSVPKDSPENVYSTRKGNELLRYYISDTDSLEVSFSIVKDIPVSFTVIEYSFDLLSNPQFTINKRPKNTMPKPFIITDAIAIKKTIAINELKSAKIDSILP